MELTHEQNQYLADMFYYVFKQRSGLTDFAVIKMAKSFRSNSIAVFVTNARVIKSKIGMDPNGESATWDYRAFSSNLNSHAQAGYPMPIRMADRGLEESIWDNFKYFDNTKWKRDTTELVLKALKEQLG